MKRCFPFILIVILIFVCVCVFFAGSTAETKKVLRYVTEPPTGLTPGKMSGPGAQIEGAVYDWLVRVNPDKIELQPELAESWENSDGKIWTVKLRKGVKWHDGKVFNADDVIFTVERSQDPAIGHKLKTALEIVEKMEKLDDYTVRFYLKKPNVKFMHLFTDFNAAILSSTYDYEKYGESKPMGTGAFMVKEIVPLESVVLVKNPNYWIEGVPKIDEIQFIFIPEGATRVAMLESGEADICREILPTEAMRVKQQPNLKVWARSAASQRVLYMGSDQPPFDDNRVRLALKYCIDAEMMAKALYGELGKTIDVTESPVGKLYPEYLNIPYRERNIKKAKQLLAEAGYPNGLDVNLHYAANLDHVSEIAVTLKEMAKPAGIRINLQGKPRDIYLSKDWLNVNFGMTGWGNRIDPVVLFNLAYKSGGPWNESHYSNPALDELIEKITSESNPVKSKELYADLQKLFYEEGPVVCIHVPKYFGMSKRVEGYREQITFIGDMRFVELND